MSEHPYDELPGLLFGELNRAEVTVVSDHLAGCDDCRRELAVLAATSASLRAAARHTSAAGEHPAGPAVRPHRGGRGAGRPGRRPRPLVGLAAALAVALVAAAVLLLTGPLRPGRAGGTVPLAGVGAVAASGQASMTGDDGDRQMTVTTDDLPTLRPGQYYELWLLDPKAGTVFPVGVLPPHGEARFTLPAAVVGRYQAIDVSLEADDGDPTHSKHSLLRGRYA
jgi:Anti-sigma-K factor rskA/Putative zinc-finger